MFGFSFLALFAVIVFFAWNGRPKQGAATALLLAFLIPKWVMLGYQNKVQIVEQLNLEIDLRVSIALFGLLAIVWRPKSILPLRPHWIDGIMLAFITLHVISDSYHSGFSFLIVLRVVGEWCLPYLLGRLAFCTLDDVRGILTIASVVVAVIGMLSVFECIFKINPYEVIFGNRPHEDDPGFSRNMSRWGMKRAYGPTTHPIYLGTLQLLLFPLAFYAASSAMRHGRKLWRSGAPVASVAGIVSTLSRGPILALLPVAYVFMLILRPRWRIGLLIAGAILAVVTFVQRDQVLITMENWAGEQYSVGRRIETDDGVDRLTSAYARIHLWTVYEYPLRRAGWLGWGTHLVDEFPVKVPLGPNYEANLDDLFEYDDPKRGKRRKLPTPAKSTVPIKPVDNEYMLLTLRFGFAAPFLFLALNLSAAGVFARMGMTEKEGFVFYAAMSGTILATSLVILGVSMPHDFGFVMIIYWGMAAGLQSRLKRGLSRRKGFDSGDNDTWTV